MWNPLKRRKKRKQTGWPGRVSRWWRIIWKLAVVLVALDLFYLMHIWPDWNAFSHGAVDRSQFIVSYAERRKQDASLPPLRWVPIRLESISPYMQRAVIVAEDARFYWHNGIDVIAFREAMDYNLEKGKLKYGGSTLSQQTVKNMFLSPSRNPLRKWHELILTLGMEFNVSKDRILETYLNVAEFGEGIYGVEAAARYYWNRSASRLTIRQAAELAATLPGPRWDNPHTRTRRFLRRTDKILFYLTRSDDQDRSR
ncbi:MAG: monofunctional biosynthetic peptidoglycan transglycosylase [Thiohalophilus sp.]|jgi:monofunctional biosynthetic peptidoglycan transglycosylase